MSLDADLATLRRPHVAMYADRKAAADRVEDELARLREAQVTTEMVWVIQRAEAAEARLGEAQDGLREAQSRCARLQQEADRQLARHLCYTSLTERERFWCAVDEALAGPGSEQGSLTESDAGLPDTPAPMVSDEGMIQPHYRPGDLDPPADSQEDKT